MEVLHPLHGRTAGQQQSGQPAEAAARQCLQAGRGTKLGAGRSRPVATTTALVAIRGAAARLSTDGTPRVRIMCTTSVCASGLRRTSRSGKVPASRLSGRDTVLIGTKVSRSNSEVTGPEMQRDAQHCLRRPVLRCLQGSWVDVVEGMPRLRQVVQQVLHYPQAQVGRDHVAGSEPNHVARHQWFDRQFDLVRRAASGSTGLPSLQRRRVTARRGRSTVAWLPTRPRSACAARCERDSRAKRIRTDSATIARIAAPAWGRGSTPTPRPAHSATA